MSDTLINALKQATEQMQNLAEEMWESERCPNRFARSCERIAKSLADAIASASQAPAVQAQDDLARELQIAVNNCCNAYFDAGHGNRVAQKYGIEFCEDAA